MKLLAKDLIKILPFDDKFKLELLREYDFFTPDQKFNIDRVLWRTYAELFELKLEENIQLALLKAKNNQEKLDENFYQRIKEQTAKEMESESIETKEKTELASARSAIEQIIGEIRASRKTK